MTAPPVSHIVRYEGGDIISDCEGQRATLGHHRCGDHVQV